ncbi:hypothetical protein BBO_08215 [Beauveria brongniartii RCEF 3172]|uniref:Uncharacterized protein n=1 Tax=Beauveria brongniartii RCEF 3172 TaxID=1081107 RepID=A0A166XYN5_9HYPO|nr:hypothetical protein BBO_08215 [Beauveria brongniartii RCEF 3172]
MSGANALGLRSNWPRLELLSDQSLLYAIALLPIVAYPFLPSVGRSGVRCELFLIWSAVVPLTLMLAMRFYFEGPILEVEEYFIWLMYTLAMAGIQGLRVPSDRLPKPTDFNLAAGLPEGFLIFALIDFFSNGIPLFTPTWIGWLSRLLYLLFAFFFILAVPLVVFTFWDAPRALFKFTTRQVSEWYWLPENGTLCLRADCLEAFLFGRYRKAFGDFTFPHDYAQLLGTPSTAMNKLLSIDDENEAESAVL